MEPIKIPTATANRLAALLQERDRVQGQINLIIQTAGEALGVPDGWELRDLSVGFEPNNPAIAPEGE